MDILSQAAVGSMVPSVGPQTDNASAEAELARLRAQVAVLEAERAALWWECAIFLFLALPLIVHAQANNGSAAPAPPARTPAPATPAVSPAPSPRTAPFQAPAPCTSELEPDLELTADNGAPVPVKRNFNYTFKNNGGDTEILVRLKDVNPYALKCTVSINSTPVHETGISAFLGLIGGVTGNLGATTPNAAPAPTPSKAAVEASKSPTPSSGKRTAKKSLKATLPQDCATQYSPKHGRVESLVKFRDAINKALRDTQENQKQTLSEFNKQVATLRSLSACRDIAGQANYVASMEEFPFAQVRIPPEASLSTTGIGAAVEQIFENDAGSSSDQKDTQPADSNSPQNKKDDSSPDSAPKITYMELPDAIDELATRAQRLVGTLTEGLTTDAGGDCKAQLKATIDQDSAFLGALINSTTAVPSAVTTWTNQLNAFNTVRSNMDMAQTSIVKVLGDRSNFVLDTSIHGDQEVVTYTASCTPVDAPTIAPPGASSTPAPAASPAPAPATGKSWSHDFKFGIGPRFVLAGGLVISPLQQVKLSTTTNPGGSGDTANTIIQQERSSTRLLPVAMLHARYWDLLPGDKWKTYYWVPNYLSVGVTAKSSDSQGTNIEYLFGPSWAFAGRQLFITAGAYAGQQQRLADFTGLTVGGPTGLSSSNLPLTQTTIWKPGFAITWAPGGK